MKHLISTILVCFAPLSWGEERPKTYPLDTWNFPYLCVTSAQTTTSVNDTAGFGSVVKNDSFIVSTNGVSRIGETQKTADSCQTQAVLRPDGVWMPIIQCIGPMRLLRIWSDLENKMLAPFAETETTHMSINDRPFESYAVLRTGKCSPINQ